MKITAENNPELPNVLTLHLEFEPEDYTPDYKKEIVQLAKGINLPGFRKGHVPTGLIEKKYGDDLLRDVIQKKSETSINEYIEQEKLMPLSRLLPSQKQESYSFKKDEKVELFLDLLIAPELQFPENPKVEVLKPIFNDEYWQLYDRKLFRQYNLEDKKEQVEESTTIKIVCTKKKEAPKTVETDAEQPTERDLWVKCADFYADWDEFSPELQALLRGKKKDEEFLCPKELTSTLTPFFFNAEIWQMNTEDTFNNAEIKLKVEDIFSYTDQEPTLELLRAMLPEQTELHDNIDKMLGYFHDLQREKMELAGKYAALIPILKQVAAEWECEIPLKIVETMFMVEGVPREQLYHSFAFLTRSRHLRELAFYTRLAKQFVVKEEHKEKDYFSRALVAMDLVNSNQQHASLIRIFNDLQQWSLLRKHMQQDEQLNDEFMFKLERLHMLEAWSEKLTDLSYRDIKVQDMNVTLLLKELQHGALPFKKTKKEEEEFLSMLTSSMSDNMKESLPAEDSKTETQPQE